jgi:release factor glutamine methyltransferase
LLVSGGALLVEHGHEQADAVAVILADRGWQAIELHRDLGGRPRVTAARRA